MSPLSPGARIREKMQMDHRGLHANGPINIVIFGDSVSHGCFNDYMDYENVYWNRLRKMLLAKKDYTPINMINAAIGGTTAKASLARMEKQVFLHAPDLLIVCFGLNDVNGSLEDYIGSLRQIFSAAQERDVPLIFMTPNMLNTYVADDAPERYRDYAAVTAEMQNSGRMDAYMDAARKLTEEMNVSLCDCYREWKKLSKTQDVTMLLSNRINHPTEAMHQLFADKLFEIIMAEEE